MKKIIALFIFAFIGLVFIFDLHSFLTLNSLKNSLDQFRSFQTESPFLVAGAFFGAYVLVTAFSIPGAAVMTLAAGALFGLLQGVALVSFASTLGATLAFVGARYLLRDSVQNKFGNRLKAINDGVEKEGAFYLFTLRLVPVVPFFLINLLMGLTRMKAFTFFWVSQLGMFAGTVVYVNAGTELAKINSLSGILSPGLIVSFMLLGIFPLITKKITDKIKARKVYAKWTKPKKFDRNMVVIGAGAAGLVSSYIAAAVKAKVTLVEAHKMGGDCLNFGCVPSKALIKSAKLAHQIRHADKYGLHASTPSFSFELVMARVHQIIKAIEPHDSVERYTSLGVDVMQGYATIVDPWTVEIKHHSGETSRLTTRSIVIAAGAAPVVPDLPGIEDIGYLTSDTLWNELATRDELPKRLVILGGGPIGSELSQAFARLGSHVIQVERGKRIMIREDEEIAAMVMESMRADGVNILTEHTAVRFERRDTQKVLIALHQGKTVEIEFDDVICATGRVARLSGYGLENIGVETNRTVVTNEYLETLYPNIFAAGDVAGPYQFTHVAAHQAWYASVNALFGHLKKFKADYSIIPWATFTDPEVARVGLNEQEAKTQGISYEVTRYGIDDLDRAIADSEAHGVVKVLTVPGKDKILGVTIAGVHAGDLLAEFVLAMKHGLGLNKILGTIHTYPTLAEANKYTAGEWKRAHAPEKLLVWLGKYHAWRLG
jgi:pyruvate/2-oxoglutarate dehydrogenase complex dihydrolipoamide dehydrogenase (E3) component/uncharacterized membrane protein YdjX (TVP38/TMEM64 family)